jgi:hypothetical protein
VTDPVASCELLGRWRIVEADLWDRDYLDMVEPAYLQIDRDGWVAFAFGCVTAGGELEYSQTIEIELSFDNGDDAILTGPANDFFNSLLGDQQTSSEYLDVGTEINSSNVSK